jgi:hypothetical protein
VCVCVSMQATHFPSSQKIRRREGIKESADTDGEVVRTSHKTKHATHERDETKTDKLTMEDDETWVEENEMRREQKTKIR